ncbi:hypothetical protein COCOBI_08-6000 [Coccomyxa sp. Obi]|nr:hypothetical protein COCOBI_08-6000 [Coccomyxa sp. Obi]
MAKDRQFQQAALPFSPSGTLASHRRHGDPLSARRTMMPPEMCAQSKSLFYFDQTQGTTEKQAARAPNNEVRAVCHSVRHGASVWLGNLNWDLTGDDMTDAIASLFSEPIYYHGPTQNEARHCCCAMVDFATEAEALELLKHCKAPQNKFSKKAKELTSKIGAPHMEPVEARIKDLQNPYISLAGEVLPPSRLDLVEAGYEMVKIGCHNQYIAFLREELPNPMYISCQPATCTTHQPWQRALAKAQYQAARFSPRDHFTGDTVRHDPILRKCGGQVHTSQGLRAPGYVRRNTVVS